MTYTHLTPNELVMIEAYYQEGATVSAIVASLERSKQTIHKVINFLKAGHSAYEYYEHYKANKKRCGRRKTHQANSVKVFIQNYLERDWSLDVIKGTYPDKIPVLYELSIVWLIVVFLTKRTCLGKVNENQMARKKREGSRPFVEIFVNVRSYFQILTVNLVILKAIRLLVRIIRALLSHL